MKKLLALILCFVMVLSLCGCDLFDSGIKLTTENYETYLNVGLTSELGGALDYSQVMGSDRKSGVAVYTDITLNISVSGKFDNYNYNDVVVKAKVTGTYLPYTASDMRLINKDEIDFEKYVDDNLESIDVSLTATTDIVGIGADSQTIDVTGGRWILDVSDISYEIIEVSGKLTSAWK